MSESPEKPSLPDSRSATPEVFKCPSCGVLIKADAKWCPDCEFTGGDTIKMFPDSPPPLLPILDAADIFSADDIQHIETARDAVRKDFPQFRWRICTVALPPDTNLSLFGFWLLNACPLHEDETKEQRTWSILLLINAGTGQAAVIPGYAAESFLSDEDCKKILGSMAQPWSMGRSAEAVVRFFECAADLLKPAWKKHGSRHAAK